MAPAPAADHASRLRRLDLFPPGQADREFRPKGIHGFFHCLMIVFAVGRDAWKIDELDQYAAVAAGRESCRIRKGGHWYTSHRSCGSIFRSRHIFANKSRPISFFRSLRVVNSSPKYKRPWLPFPLSATNWQATFLRRASFCIRRSARQAENGKPARRRLATLRDYSERNLCVAQFLCDSFVELLGRCRGPIPRGPIHPDHGDTS